MHGKIDNQIKPFSLNCVTAKDVDGNVKRVFPCLEVKLDKFIEILLFCFIFKISMI